LYSCDSKAVPVHGIKENWGSGGLALRIPNYST
jgi:hypothetical protein